MVFTNPFAYVDDNHDGSSNRDAAEIVSLLNQRKKKKRRKKQMGKKKGVIRTTKTATTKRPIIALVGIALTIIILSVAVFYLLKSLGSKSELSSSPSTFESSSSSSLESLESSVSDSSPSNDNYIFSHFTYLVKKKDADQEQKERIQESFIIVEEKEEEEEEEEICKKESADFHRDERKKEQIENYRKGSGLIFSMHMTHHGGTGLCGIIGRNGNHTGDKAPVFACSGVGRDNPEQIPADVARISEKELPWPCRKTDEYIRLVRPHFHFISSEWRTLRKRKVGDMNLEHSKLVSIVVMRDPIGRMFAGDGFVNPMYPGYNTGELDHDGWWRYATDDKLGNPFQTDNFFLRLFLNKKGGYKREKGELVLLRNYTNTHNSNFTPPELAYPLNETDYNDAVELLNRFTYVLDIRCLSEGMIKIAKELELNMDGAMKEIDRGKKMHPGKKESHSLSNRERIGYDDVYEYLMEKNKWDIELYEYSKSISVVNCSDVSGGNYTGRRNRNRRRRLRAYK